MKIDKQIALVTGGSSGMGQATAQALKHAGAKVVIWDVTPPDKAHPQLALRCDVSLEHEVEAAMEETIAKVGIPRICIHCAGIAPAKRMLGKEGVMPLADFKRVIDINLIGSFNVMRIAAQAMAQLNIEPDEEERGVIIHTASIAAFEGQIGQLAYSASKGGIVSMTLPAARELANFAIRVNTIAPGLMATPLLLNMPESVQKNLSNSIVFPQRFGEPKEFSALALHLIENSFINGEVIRLDGGLRMQAR